ncbi:MAG: hypothetical protein ACFE9L_21485 [Candidatus Hodarchaeota archaeon]
MSLFSKIIIGILLTISIPSIIVMGLYTLTQLNEGDLSNDYIGIQQILLDNSAFENSPRDAVAFNKVTLDKNLLIIEVSYGGGCRQHFFALIGSNVFMESYPVQTNIVLSHNANDDPCEALLTETLNFDLSPLKIAYQEAYSVSSGSIIIHLEGVENSILYEF